MVVLEALRSGHWVLGKDGLPTNPRGKQDCEICKGDGIVEDYELSAYCSVLVDCSCTQNKHKEIQSFESGLGHA